MDEILLKETIEKLNIKEDEENKYSANSSTDLFEILQQSLTNSSIDFKKIPKNTNNKKNRNLLRLFDNGVPFLDFNKGFYPNNSKVGKIIANDKLLTEKFLKKAGIKTPETTTFKENEYKQAEEFINNKKGIFVVKPKDLSHALGAFRNVTKNNFKECWNRSLKVQKLYKVKTPIIIVQNQVEGIELRVTVTEGIVDTVSIRVPGFIVGDGITSVKSLIDKKNKKRKEYNVYHGKNLLKINDNLLTELKEKGLTLDSVLDRGEYLILYPQTNISIGRENYEITKHVHPDIINQAKDAVIAIPGVHTAGVDIIVGSLDSNEGTVIEVNQNPAFQLNYYPMFGDIQDPLGKIFNSLSLENKIKRKDIDLESLDQETFDLLLEKYKFLYDKVKILEEQLNIQVK